MGKAYKIVSILHGSDELLEVTYRYSRTFSERRYVSTAVNISNRETQALALATKYKLIK